MSRRYKDVKNGRGTNLTITPEKYISVGFEGTDVTIRGNGKVLAFDNWNDFVDAINQEKSVYYSCDYPGEGRVGTSLVSARKKESYNTENCPHYGADYERKDD